MTCNNYNLKAAQDNFLDLCPRGPTGNPKPIKNAIAPLPTFLITSAKYTMHRKVWGVLCVWEIWPFEFVINPEEITNKANFIYYDHALKRIFVSERSDLLNLSSNNEQSKFHLIIWCIEKDLFFLRDLIFWICHHQSWRNNEQSKFRFTFLEFPEFAAIVVTPWATFWNVRSSVVIYSLGIQIRRPWVRSPGGAGWRTGVFFHVPPS